MKHFVKEIYNRFTTSTTTTKYKVAVFHRIRMNRNKINVISSYIAHHDGE